MNFEEIQVVLDNQRKFFATGKTLQTGYRLKVLKVSQQVPHTNAVMKRIIDDLPPELIMMLNGDHSVSEQLLNHKFDYIFFTGSKKLEREFLSKTRSGTAAVNDTVVQIASPYIPYGGVGCSGMGKYHGKNSFKTFSNMRAVVNKSTLIDFPIRYPPYTKLKTRFLSLLMR